MKRFYSTVDIAQAPGGWQIRLDGRAVKTQGGQPQIVQSRALAELLLHEWDQQGETIDRSRFVHRDLADYAIDVVASDPTAVITDLLRYAETDTLCYRADPDEPLWQRQCAVWDPLLQTLEERENIAFQRISGVIHRPQSADTLIRLRHRLERLDPFALAALEALTTLPASLVIGLSALEADADGEALWNAANLEEDWQAELWGRDSEAEQRRMLRRDNFLAAQRFARAALD